MHTSDLHQSFKFKIKFSKVFWGTRLRQWIARVREAGQGGARVAFLRMCLYEATSVACRIFLIKYLLFTSLNSAGKIITIYRTDVHSASCLSKKNLTCYTKPYIFISLSVKVLHVSVHTRFGTFHQCADQKFSRLLWFSFLTAAKIFLYCTTVHPALCPNIIAIKNVQMLWNLEHFQQFFFFISFFWLKRHLEIYEKSHSFWKYSFYGTEANP